MHEEYLMQFNPIKYNECREKLQDVLRKCARTTELDCECEEDTLYYYEGEELVAELSVFVEDGRVNLYDVEVMPELRGQGYGLAVMMHFLAEEFPYLDEIFPVAKKERCLVLQVSSENVPAYKLYQSVGFEVIEAVSIS